MSVCSVVKSLWMAVNAEFWLLRVVCCAFHCVSGVRSALASSVTTVDQSTPEARPVTANDGELVEDEVRPICVTVEDIFWFGLGRSPGSCKRDGNGHSRRFSNGLQFHDDSFGHG